MTCSMVKYVTCILQHYPHMPLFFPPEHNVSILLKVFSEPHDEPHLLLLSPPFPQAVFE